MLFLNRLSASAETLPHSARWFRAWWFAACISVPLFAALLLALLEPQTTTLALYELLLWGSFVPSLWILARGPLLDPLQSGAILFYFWFGVGPVAVLLWAHATGSFGEAWERQQPGIPALPFVAAGLLFYAAGASLAMRFLRRFRVLLPPLGAGLDRFEGKSLLAFWGIGLAIAAMLRLLPLAGIQGVTEINFLGGTRTDIWWVGLLAAAARILLLANLVAITSIVQPRFRTLPCLGLLGGLILAGQLVMSLRSGWKGAFVFPLFYVVVAWLSRRQRPPVIAIGAILAVFLLFVEPFVSAARAVATARGAESTPDRIAVFQEVLSDFVRGERLGGDNASWNRANPEILFRGIFPVAGETIRRSHFFGGPWGGATLARGILGSIPRALFPEKPDMDVGHFFATEIGVDVGWINPKDETTSIAITIPAEVAGNFGTAVGILSFGALGALWALIVAAALGPEPTSHPLNPFFVGLTLLFETPFGGFLAVLRDLVMTYIVVFSVWFARGRRL